MRTVRFVEWLVFAGGIVFVLFDPCIQDRIMVAIMLLIWGVLVMITVPTLPDEKV